MKRVLTFSLVYGAYVLFLHTVDGPWRRWKVGRERKLIDPWTLQHVLWGALANTWGLSQTQLLVLGAINEGLEYWIRRERPDLLWGTPESGVNVASDLAASALGWWAAQKARAA